METSVYEPGKMDIAWCPGCGNFAILKILKAALAELDIDPHNLVVVSGIGQAAKAPQYFNTNFFNGLHGRSLPAATAIKVANPELTVIAESGDGCMYGEGGNHFMSAIRRNTDITVIVHNNMVYGLTKGQASPTSQPGFKTPVQVEGVISYPFNPLTVAIALDASFVARASVTDPDGMKEIIKKALTHKGFALVDVFQTCVSFNKVNTYKWFKEHTYYLEDDYDPKDRDAAFKRASEEEKLPMGIFYMHEKPTFEEQLEIEQPLYRHEVDFEQLEKLIDSKRRF